MRIPVIHGIIERRILANYRLDPEVASSIIPAPFKPQIVNGYAIAGICFIRLKEIRPKFIPKALGLHSENAAHRFAVEWFVDGVRQTGVYIPCRYTSSKLNAWAGGRLFPGMHHHAHFNVEESNNSYSIKMHSTKGENKVHFAGELANQLPSTSIFNSLTQASDFFQSGALGYSATAKKGKYDGVELRCDEWNISPLNTKVMESNYFDNTSLFPKKSINFDCAFEMHNISHQWHGCKSI